MKSFYRALGWQEVGTWPYALRLTETDRCDEVLIFLALR